MVRKVLLGVGEGLGEGPRKKYLATRGKAEGLYEFPKIHNRRFAKLFIFYMACYGNGMFALIYQEEVVLCSVLSTFSNRPLIFCKTADK